MHRPRLIPCLLLEGDKLVKTTRFARSTYVGDPLNSLKIFNDKEVDELILLDIGATRLGQPPNFDLIARIASECFMPVCYGGGIRCVADAERLISGGIEKIALNSAAIDRPKLIEEIAHRYGSSSVVVSINVKRSWARGLRVWHSGTRRSTGMRPLDWACQVAAMGAGEVLLYAVDRDGTFEGYDLPLIKMVANAVPVPVIACGGASDLEDCRTAIIKAGASAAAAGALFVYKGPHRAVLINYPNSAQLQNIFRQ